MRRLRRLKRRRARAQGLNHRTGARAVLGRESGKGIAEVVFVPVQHEMVCAEVRSRSIPFDI